MNEEQNKIGEQAPKKSNAKKWLFLSLGVAATGALSYFGWQYWKNNKNQDTNNNEDGNDANVQDSPNNYTPKPKAQPNRNDDFPLQKGSKGANVKAVQEALIAKYGKSILPKYGADGDFGSEMVNALKKSGLSESIDESTFNVLVNGGGSNPDLTSIASQLYEAATKKDFLKVIALLKTLHNTTDYKAASEAFKNYRINGVRQTLVNGLLNSFTDEKQKQGIRLAFSAMGLKYDGSKWSLSGFEKAKMLISNRPSRVWKNPKTSVPIPANMVLGIEITKRGEYTLFENDKQYFLIQSQHVNYYK